MCYRKLPLICASITIALFTSGNITSATEGSNKLIEFILTEEPSGDQGTYIATGLQTNGLQRGSGVNARSLTNGFSANQWTEGNDMPSHETAVENREWLGFDVTVEPDYTASFDSVQFWLRRSARSSPMFFELRYSFDGFATEGTPVQRFTYRGRASGGSVATLTDPDFYMTWDAPDSFMTPFDMPLVARGQSSSSAEKGNPIPPINLSHIRELQDIRPGTTVTFGLFAWGNLRTVPSNTVALGRHKGPLLRGTVTRY